MAEVMITSESIEGTFFASSPLTFPPIGQDARTPAIEVALRDVEKGLVEPPSATIVQSPVDSKQLSESNATDASPMVATTTEERANQDTKTPTNTSTDTPAASQALALHVDTALIKVYIEPDIFGSREITTRVDLETIELYFLFPPKLSFSDSDGDVKYGDLFLALRKAHDVVVMDSLLSLLKAPEYHRAKLNAYPSLKIVSMALYSKFARFYWQMLRDRIRMLIKKHTPLLKSMRYYVAYTKKKVFDWNTYKSANTRARDRFERESVYLTQPLLYPDADHSFIDHFHAISQLEKLHFLSKKKIEMLKYLCVMFERNVEYFMHPMDCSKLPSLF